jgi:hypothetical protein
MLPYRDSRLSRIALLVFFLAVIIYAYYEARGLFFGPSIAIPAQTMSATDNSYILIQGQADRISSLSVDGDPIQVTETGAFSEPYVLAPGVNRIVFDAKDKYGNKTQKVIEIVYTPTTDSTASTSSGQASSTTLTASSSPRTTDSTSSPQATAPIAPGQ